MQNEMAQTLTLLITNNKNVLISHRVLWHFKHAKSFASSLANYQSQCALFKFSTHHIMCTTFCMLNFFVVFFLF